MRFWLRFLIALLLAIGSAFAFWNVPRDANWVELRELPVEARDTLTTIKRGGPFPYSRDGIVFNNFEKRLPQQARGYYREYTVPTPGRRDRGPRRIVAGQPGEYYYTADHYETFRRIRE